MTPDRYRSLLREYDALLDHARAISASLTGRQLRSREDSYADTIFTKLLLHGISLRKLCPKLQDGELWDIASTCAVARALIETYDALAYVAVHPVSIDERDFRILLWRLHDQQRRLQMLDRVKSSNPQVQEIRASAALLLEAVLKHATYSTLSKDLQGRVSRGDAPAFHLSQRALNVASGVDHDFYVSTTMYLSQQVHTFPMALSQLMAFQPGEPDSLRVSSMPLQYSMPFLAKAIEAATQLWPEAVGDTSESLSRLLQSWIAIAEHGLPGAD
jgi:hypothetical protein